PVVGAGFHARPLFLPLTREVARRSRDGGRETKKISPPVKCCAFDSPLVRGGGNGGGKPPPYPEKCLLCIENGFGHFVKYHKNPRAGMETRPYKFAVKSNLNPFRSLFEGDSPRCGEMSAKQTKGTAPSALSAKLTEGVYSNFSFSIINCSFFTPSVKTYGFATSLTEGGKK
ncbi:MAG: hypothetical protein ACI4KI_04735, partial [Candidatus Fimenecus sp.]